MDISRGASKARASTVPSRQGSSRPSILDQMTHVCSVHRATRHNLSNFEPRAKDKLFEQYCRNQEASVRRLLNFPLHTGSKCFSECGNDSVPAEGWSDRSQNCVHDMYVVSNTQLIWNRQQ